MGFTKLRYVTVDLPENLTSQFALADKQDGSNTPVLIINLSGEYPTGSRGNAHGAYIATMRLLGVSAFDRWSVILDFTDLQYQMGKYATEGSARRPSFDGRRQRAKRSAIPNPSRNIGKIEARFAIVGNAPRQPGSGLAF